MAAIAIHWRPGIAAAGVALLALKRSVSARQGEIREGRMIEFRALPAIKTVAGLAICG